MMRPTNGQLALRACLAEVFAPKAGNVYPGAPFDDATWEDFAVSAMAIAPVLDRAGELGVGQTILQSVIATHEAVGHNTNLGIVLLLSPLCVAENNDDLPNVLASLTEDDTQDVYEAIRIANPGGLNSSDDADVSDAPPPGLTLLDAMQLAADRDTVARQYVTDFHDVITQVAGDVATPLGGLDEAIRMAHLKQMAREPDSLIFRKCGIEIARQSQRFAQRVLAGEVPFDTFDAWLREEEHCRNPGSSADLIAAGLFVAMRDGRIEFPQRWTQGLSSCHEGLSV